MRRRALLAGTGAGIVVPLTGCLADNGESGDDTNDPTGEWLQFQADAAHTGATTAAGPDGGGRIRWWSDTSGLSTGPVVKDGTVCIGTGVHNQSVFAFEQATGDQQWQAKIGDDIERALAVGDELVYASAGGVYALDVETGEQEWMDNVDTSWGLAFADDTVFAAAGGGGPLVAFEAETGEERWSREIHTITTPSIDDGRVFAVGNDNLIAIDVENGETDWTKTIDRAGGPPTVADGTVFVGTRKDLFAHDTATGDRKWTLEGNFRATDIATIDGTLYLAGQQQEGDEWVSRALAVEAATGDVEWTRDDEVLGDGSVVVTEETVYVTTPYRVYALDPKTGDIKWWLRFQWPVSSPAVADETLYVSVGGRLLAIVSGDGRAGVWTSDAEPIPDRGATPPEPSYAGTDFSFGMGGFDVSAEWNVEVEEDAPVDVSFTTKGDRIDTDEDVSMTLAVTNESDETLRSTTGAPEPFGIFRLGSEDRHITAWTSAYEESGHVHTSPHRGITGVNSIGLSTEIPPGETVSETYTISDETNSIQPGTYEFSVEKRLKLEDDRDDHDGWDFEVRGAVELEDRGTDTGDIVHDLVVADEVSLPKEFMGRFTVDVVEPVTDTHPGMIEVTFENVTDERSLIASMRHWPFGSYVGHGPEDRRLVLLPAETYAPGFVERTNSGWWEPAFLPHESIVQGRGTTAYDPGERSTKQFIVTTHPETGDPRDGDSFAFEQGFGDDDVDVIWGFALSTLDPDR
ncbi:PQQ-binding-like beta-propeller repeat protein [Saliphagus infecundisoli]|uniref:PQQ-binding-like beta-propeller repeat protein n=1 Tax=Saliphagus infecundisoli TaxID=1849069 RepID=A0ABD5QLZ4_9EURY|nr:PQQ-binding-like beta-propeller repeat protein [Saliphagus infecundisoli]